MRVWPAAIAAIAFGAAVLYALDSGVYVGPNFYVRGATCCPEQDEIVKYCRYLFVTGISEIPAGNGTRTVPGERKRNEDLAAGIKSEWQPAAPPDQGYCRIIGSGQAEVQLLTR